MTALTAVGALVFTGLSLNSTQQGQITDRFTKAVEQLDKTGDDHLQARFGGIYSLERLAHDSPRDQPTIIEVLSAFIRTNTRSVPYRPDIDTPTTCPDQKPKPDIQAALTVLGRRDTAYDNRTSIDLRRTCLLSAQLDGANFSGAQLSGADLTYASFKGAHLRGVRLDNAVLVRVDLTDVDLQDAYLYGANIERSGLHNADLTHVELWNASLSGSNLEGANFTRANLFCTNLSGAYLIDANLNGANIQGTDLRGAGLRGVKHDESTVIDSALMDGDTQGKWW